ncbi:MAG: thioredoxin 1 [Clostridiales bacterium]|jgi:thioredoxin 1|nr:thioredoxin 1 [Clostridiales bacterium]MDN5282373.1 thioredoxin 1 [Candidatus Ozemobacter sp.]
MKNIFFLCLMVSFSVAAFAQVDSTPTALAKKLPRLVDFGSKQCRACKAMEPVLESCAAKYADKFKTEFVDVWQTENQAYAKANEIQSIPTQIFFDHNGKELFRHTGFISEEDILARWQKLGFAFVEAGSDHEKADEAEPGKIETGGETDELSK